MKRDDDDDGLRARLQNLRRSDSKIDQKEIEERLAKLKGVDPAHYSAPPITVYQPPDNRTDAEKSDHLLAQLMEESSIDQKTRNERSKSVDEEFEERLARLRGTTAVKEKPVDMDVEERDSDEECDEVVEQLMAEANLPDVPSGQCDSIDDKAVIEMAAKMRKEKEKIAQEVVEEDAELPWCSLCNEDARLRCLDCEGDLYCFSCFKEFHCDSDTKGHRTKAYRAPKGKVPA